MPKCINKRSQLTFLQEKPDEGNDVLEDGKKIQFSSNTTFEYSLIYSLYMSTYGEIYEFHLQYLIIQWNPPKGHLINQDNLNNQTAK